MSQPLRILFISTGLGVGGAEVMLVNLVSKLVAGGHVVRVVGLKAPGGVTARLREAGAIVDEPVSADLAGTAAVLWRLKGILDEFKPDLIQGWMYQGGLVASCAGFLSGVPVAWSLHHSNFEPRYNGRGTLASIRVCAWISRWLTPAGIAYCGPNSRDAHHRHGFTESPASIIPNGVDFDKFKPDAVARAVARAEIGATDDEVVIGIFANRVFIKDHTTFFRGAAALAVVRPEVRFICCGAGMSPDSTSLVAELESLGLSHRVQLLGRRSDVPAMMNACDIIALTSRGESFPMALTEAAACGVPVVATDVGDCAWVVGDSTRLFHPGDVAELVQVLHELVSAGATVRGEIGAANRRRIEGLFSLDAVTRSYLALAHRAMSSEVI